MPQINLFFLSKRKEETRNSPDLRKGSSIYRRAADRVGMAILAEERFYPNVILERPDMEQSNVSKKAVFHMYGAAVRRQEKRFSRVFLFLFSFLQACKI